MRLLRLIHLTLPTRTHPTAPTRVHPTAPTQVHPAVPARSGAVRASGLPAYWQRHYASLRTAGAADAAERHIQGTIATLPLPYRLGYCAVLRAMPALFRCAGGHSLHRAPAAVDRLAMARLSRLPGVAQVLRASTALALYGALDGPSPQAAVR
ncbi:hypothetical protein ACFVVX_25155 [Kitasatospora sp. NPDC058170]|uniref:hypothetical protein n=1 Tax=Kitasatospora sp. NPDC058170 TaxID=3346364 RepID=UPI0036DAA986